MGFLPAGPCFRTVSAVNAQTYWTVTSILIFSRNICFILSKNPNVKNCATQPRYLTSPARIGAAWYPVRYRSLYVYFSNFSKTLFYFSPSALSTGVTVHTCVLSNGILPMLRIPNRQNLLPELYHTEFSVQKIPTCEQLPTDIYSPGCSTFQISVSR